VKVALYAATGLAIRYTLDGTAPTASSPLYTGPFWLKSTATVKAFCGSRNPSSAVSRTYTLDGTPRIAPDSGLLANQTSVTVTMTSTSSEIRYTTDGTDPTQLSPGYTGPITLTTFPVTVKARAFWPEAAPSSVSSVTYTKTADGIVIPKESSPFIPRTFTGRLVDDRDDHIYRTIAIGTQVWMAENLNYTTGVGTCYNRSSDSCSKYGGLYTWVQALKLSSDCEKSVCNSQDFQYQGICPTGWHVPRDSEWTILMNYVGGSTTAGTKLKSTFGWSDSGNGTDAYGFRGLPAGEYTPSTVPGSFRSVHRYGYWLSSTAHNGGTPIYGSSFSLSSTSETSGVGRSSMDDMRSLRCVRDQ
jgi:uncharacterized protein (TIGR02145 family)